MRIDNAGHRDHIVQLIPIKISASFLDMNYYIGKGKSRTKVRMMAGKGNERMGRGITPLIRNRILEIMSTRGELGEKGGDSENESQVHGGGEDGDRILLHPGNPGASVCR